MDQVLVDTSVWIRHFRVTNMHLRQLLDEERVVTHELIIAELAVGSIPKREQTLRDLGHLKVLQSVALEEFLTLVDSSKLAASGLSAIDVHLLASAIVAGVELFTHDTKLNSARRRIELRR